MKKILFMLSSINIGGVEKSFLSLLSVLPREKYDVTLLLLERKGGFLDAVPDWVQIEEANWFQQVKPIIMQSPQQTIQSYWRQHAYYRMFCFILTYVTTEKITKNRYAYYKHVCKDVPIHSEVYDVAISYHGPTDIIDFYVAEKVQARQKMAWIHFDISKHTINTRLYQKLYTTYDKLFVVSKEALRKLVAKIPDVEHKAEVSYSIVSHDLIRVLAMEEVSFDDDYEGFKLITVGRLAQEKGLDLALSALKRLREAGHEVRWYVIGEGKQRKHLEAMIKDHQLSDSFVLLGAKTNPYPYIKRADMYVQPSRHEGYCLTLAEARSLRKPIVATNFTGAQEQIINGVNGWIVETDVDSLYLKLHELLEDRYTIAALKQTALDGKHAENVSRINWL